MARAVNTRTKLGTGKRITLERRDSRTMAGRHFRVVLEDIIASMDREPTAMDMHQARQCAALYVQSELLIGRLAAGEAPDADFCNLSLRLATGAARILQSLQPKAPPKASSQSAAPQASLKAYLAQTGGPDGTGSGD